MNDKGITETEYNRGGYGKYHLSREYINEVRTRTRDDKGKVYRGEAGKQLLRRKLEVQKWHEQHQS
jgi:hypothetical protein